jgi:hypothetical protein
MMYVSDRSADSICDTWCAFLAMKSSYRCSHRVDGDRAVLLPELSPAREPEIWLCVAGRLDMAGTLTRIGAAFGVEWCAATGDAIMNLLVG